MTKDHIGICLINKPSISTSPCGTCAEGRIIETKQVRWQCGPMLCTQRLPYSLHKLTHRGGLSLLEMTLPVPVLFLPRLARYAKKSTNQNTSYHCSKNPVTYRSSDYGTESWFSLMYSPVKTGLVLSAPCYDLRKFFDTSAYLFRIRTGRTGWGWIQFRHSKFWEILSDVFSLAYKV
jgi:hypothetical protein